LNPTQKKLLKKTIEQSICGNYLEETLTCHKKRIASELNDIANSKNLQIKFDQIENDYKNLEYFCYFHYKNFDNPHTPNANFSSTSSSSLNKTGNFGNSNSNTNNETNINSNTSNNNNYNFNCSNKNNNFITPSNNTNPPNNNLTNNNNNNNNLSINNKNSQPKQFTKIIGSGAFGDVYLVKNIMDGKLFAIKQLSREKVKENGIDTELVYREINTHFKLIHNNIARLFDYYEDKKAYYLIMEYVDNGTLFNKIQKVNGLPEEKALKYFVQVSSAIFFLHENQFIHRDIKPENCLIDKNDNVKLCDFGWTVEISKGERITFCGTYEYMAPEIIKEVPYNHMIDVWSLGVLLYELIHSFSPFRVIYLNFIY
jgi:tRNA A-37 threonylcarbamoyl transferase component Bud32